MTIILSHPQSFPSLPPLGSHDIFQGNVKLISGVIWTLIQKYQIRMTSKLMVIINNYYNNKDFRLPYNVGVSMI